MLAAFWRHLGADGEGEPPPYQEKVCPLFTLAAVASSRTLPQRPLRVDNRSSGLGPSRNPHFVHIEASSGWVSAVPEGPKGGRDGCAAKRQELNT